MSLKLLLLGNIYHSKKRTDRGGASLQHHEGPERALEERGERREERGGASRAGSSERKMPKSTDIIRSRESKSNMNLWIPSSG